MVAEFPTSDQPPSVFDALADRRRRIVLAELSERDRPVPIGDLAAAVADAEGVADPDTDRVRLSLHHVHLPLLVDAGLIDRDREAGTVSAAAHPALEGAWLSAVLDGSDREAADRLFRALANPRRRSVLAILTDRDDAVSVGALAAALASRESDGSNGGADGDREVDAVRIDLVHVHLPALADAGIIAYDPRQGTVAGLSDSPDRPAWIDAGPIAALVGAADGCDRAGSGPA